ncbi:MAG: tetratricopeptide repeat protein [Anaerolineales bacterium]
MDRIPVLIALAMILLTLSPTAAPRDLGRMIESARRAWTAGRPSAALEDLEEALQREPALGPALHLAAGRAAVAAGLPAAAAEHARQALEGGWNESEAACLLFEARWAGNEAGQALPVRIADLSQCGLAASTLDALAADAMKNGAWPMAEEALQVLVAASPADAEARLNLGLVIALENPAAALAHLEAAVALGRGQALLASRVADAARAAPPGPPTPSYLVVLGQELARAGRWSLAEPAFARAVELRPGFALGHAYLGLARDEAGKDGGADLRRALGLLPGSSLIHTFLGRHWLARGNLAAASAEFQTAAILNLADPAPLAHLGEVYLLQGDLESAEAAFRAAVLRAPDEPAFWLLLAQHSLSHEIEVESLGIVAARKVVLLDPSLAAGWDALGHGHLLLGETELAERLLRRSLALDPGRVSSRYRLGVVFRLQGRDDLAETQWRSVLELDPGGPFAHLALRALQGR